MLLNYSSFHHISVAFESHMHQLIYIFSEKTGCLCLSSPLQMHTHNPAAEMHYSSSLSRVHRESPVFLFCNGLLIAFLMQMWCFAISSSIWEGKCLRATCTWLHTLLLHPRHQPWLYQLHQLLQEIKKKKKKIPTTSFSSLISPVNWPGLEVEGWWWLRGGLDFRGGL